jgi:hypothetical protein
MNIGDVLAQKAGVTRILAYECPKGVLECVRDKVVFE